MTCDKSKAQKGPQQKHLHSRISYLFQAATYLADINSKAKTCTSSSDEDGQNIHSEKSAVSDVYSNKSHQIMPAASEYQPVGTTASKADKIPQFSGAGPSRRLLAHLRAVSLKGQVRLSPKMKHSICKRCDLLLVPGSSATLVMENKSRGGKKPWADVLVITCMSCGTPKQFPVGAKRQSRKAERSTEAEVEAVHNAAAS